MDQIIPTSLCYLNILDLDFQMHFLVRLCNYVAIHPPKKTLIRDIILFTPSIYLGGLKLSSDILSL